MTRWLDTNEQRAWRAYRRMGLRVDSAIAQQLKRQSGLSTPDYQVLSLLSESPEGRQRLSNLAPRIPWSISRLSHHVTRMQTRGLVSRVESDTNARFAEVALTDNGRAELNAAAPGHVEVVRQNLFDLLTPEEVATLTLIAEKIADARQPFS